MAAGIAGAAALQGPIGETNAERRANDFRYTPDPRVMSALAGAHKSTVADLLWLRALPDMARPFHDRAMKKRWLAGATDVVTDLEPSFYTAYAYGADYLNIIDKDPDEAIKLLTKGIEKNPGTAGLYVRLAMVYFDYKKDRAKTMELLEKASTMDGIDSLSLAMLASMKVNEHDDFVALAMWAKNLEDAPNEKARTICRYELWRTKAMIANRAAREFRAAHPGRFKIERGDPPLTAEDLRDPKLMDKKVLDVVLDGLVFDAKGVAGYDKLIEYERPLRIAQADDVVAAFLSAEGQGRLPSKAEFFRQFGPLPDPPKGQKWDYDEAAGKLRLIAE